jgi:AAA15 family ATPase/GTPase
MNKEQYNKYARKWYHKHCNVVLKRQAEYRKNNPEKIKQQKKEHRERCRDYYINYFRDYYQKHKEKIKQDTRQYAKTEKGKLVSLAHTHKRKRNLNFIIMFDNPFDESELIDWHHINDAYVVAIPRDLHKLYGGKYHRSNMMTIVKQIYSIEG